MHGLLGIVISFFLFFFALDTQAQTVDICDRTPEVEAEILQRIGVTGLTCDAVTSAQLSGVSILDLASESITSLKEDDFERLTSLESLWLHKNSLSSLPEDLFDGLTSLEILDLGHNSLTSLPEDLFDGLTSLEELWLQDNSLASQPEDLYNGLTSLEKLLLYDNSLTSLPSGLFDGLTSLGELWLYGNSLTNLPEDLFNGLTSLETLWLSSNSLTSLPEDLFDGLTSLNKLSLSNNSLTSLSEDLFDGLTSLDELWIYTNSLTSLPEDLFNGLTSLEALSLSSNSLTSVAEGLFDGLTSLETLSLSNNWLTGLPEDLFDGLTSLEILDLSTNPLSNLPANLFDHVKPPQALSIWLGSNSIDCLPAAIVNNSAVTMTPKFNVCGISIATLLLSPASISESGESTTVTATLDRPSVEVTTISVSVDPQAPASTSDYTLSATTVLTIAAGATTSMGTVTITAVKNEVDAPNKTVQVKGTATNRQGVTAPKDVTLTIIDDDDAPTATLVLTPTSISEDAGSTTVTATLDRASIAETTIEVSAVPDFPATTSDYTLSSNTTLTIAAGELASTGAVTIGAVDNSTETPDKTIQVGGTAQNAQGVTGPSVVTLTITDDGEASEVTLTIVPSEINEDAGRTDAMVTAMLDVSRDTDTKVTVTVEDGSAVAGTDYSAVSSFDITILANQLSGTGRFFFVPTSDDIDEPDETVLVTGTTSVEELGVSGITLTITDDDDAPTAMLVLTPTSISEDAGSTTVTATLDRASITETTIEVSAVPDFPATTSDYILSSNTRLTIAAGELASTGVVTIGAVDNSTDTPDKTIQVGGAAQNAQGVTGPLDVTLTITDDDEASEVTLAVVPFEVNEDAGRTDVMVTAMLDVSRDTDTMVTVSVGDGTAVAGTAYSAVSSFDITILANQLSGTGRFTFTPTRDDIDEPNGTVLVTGTATVNGLAVTGTALTITDDDPAPVVMLTVSPASISEAGDISTVTARLDRPSSEETTVMITTQPQAPATTSDYTLSTNRTLTIAAGSKMSTGEVTITSVDNGVHVLGKKVMVQGTAANTQGITSPAEVVLTIINEDGAETAPIATDVTVTATEDTPYRFQVSDFGYSDPDGDPLREVRIMTHPQTGTLTMEGTEVTGNTPVTVKQLAAGALVFTSVADGYGTPYTSFTFRVSDGTLESLLPAALTIVVEPVNDAATGRPEILGSMQVGQPLRVSTQDILDVDGTSNAVQGAPPHAFRYQWLRMQAGQFAPIHGADTDIYVPVVADGGARLVVRVRFLDDAGFSEDLSSPPREVLHTGRIRQAWMARFGRAIADQILAATACDGRQLRPDPGGVYLGGHPLGLSSMPNYVRLKREDRGSIVPVHGESGPTMTHTLTLSNLVRGTSFRHVGNPGGDQGVIFWGRGARSRFRGSENASMVDGVITSGMVGTDWRQHRISLGILANYTNADGNYDSGSESGQVSGQLVGIYPNVCYAISSRVRVWAVAGYGRGDLTLDGRDTRRYQSPLHLMMGGGGVYGHLRTIANQLELGVRSDALIARTIAGQTEMLPRDVAQVTRLRLGLKGTVRGLQLKRDVRIEPALEMALRHDGGDADTGFGVDMSAGLVVSTLTRGLSMEVQARGVLTHQAQGLREQGMTAAVTWDPTPNSASGVHVRMEQTMGAEVFGGADRLLRAETVESYSMDASDSRGLGPGQLKLEAGYGFAALRGRLITQPAVGLAWWGSRRRYRIGWEFAFVPTNPTRLWLFVGATGRDPAAGKFQLQHQISLQLRREW